MELQGIPYSELDCLPLLESAPKLIGIMGYKLINSEPWFVCDSEIDQEIKKIENQIKDLRGMFGGYIYPKELRRYGLRFQQKVAIKAIVGMKNEKTLL